MKKKKKIEGEITKNKKAFFDYEILKSYEGGIDLKGHETKSIRHGHLNLKGSFLVINGTGIYIKNMHITAWKALPNRGTIDTFRERKVFLHKKDIEYLSGKMKEKGNTLVPLSMYFKGSLIKIQVGLVKGKKQFEKKQVLKERSMKKEASIAASKYL
ncbi:MAG: SsrA-binding protein SmpB [Candidatus Gracilibacteria bacterium]|nr:SsrA-binding protein SmpB [Candidatus Gracilibacteria bacterium]MDQ7022528.1 SsrA-binding protein SmpB [Candidatus Gracilibacteria bacterium]